MLKLPKPLEEYKKNLEFDFEVHQLEKDISDQLKGKIAGIIDFLEEPVFRGPLYSLTYELTVNSLKAIYKKIYYKFLEEEMGLKDLSYEKALAMFKAEIESHGTENLSKMAKEKWPPVIISFRIEKENLCIRVVNDGTPSSIETRRIAEAIHKAKKINSFQYLFNEDDDGESSDSLSEGAGLGLAMIVMTLRNLGVSLENFEIFTQNERTISQIEIPLLVFMTKQISNEIQVVKGEETPFDNNNEYLNKMSYYMMRFDIKGNLMQITENFLNDFKQTFEKVNEIKKIIPDQFIEEVFLGPKGIKLKERFENYRLSLPVHKDGTLVMFNVHGYLSANSTVVTIWKPDSIDLAISKIAEDSVFYKLKLKDNFASQTKEGDFTQVTSGPRTYSIIFGEVLGLADFISSLDQFQAIPLLNMIFEVIVKSIERHGGIMESFMNNAFSARFVDPLNAVIASGEIQALFFTLNTFRLASKEKPIEMQIGVHTGSVVLGQLKNDRLRQQVLYGDTIYIAMRLSRHALAGGVNVSEETYSKIQGNVTWSKRAMLTLKKRNIETRIYFLDSIKYMLEKKNYILSLRKRKNDVLA